MTTLLEKHYRETLRLIQLKNRASTINFSISRRYGYIWENNINSKTDDLLNRLKRLRVKAKSKLELYEAKINS